MKIRRNYYKSVLLLLLSLLLVHWPVQARFGRQRHELPSVVEQQNQRTRFGRLRRQHGQLSLVEKNEQLSDKDTPEEEGEEESGLIPWDTALDVSTDVATALYGLVLIQYGHLCQGQILVMTVMRAAGYSKLERALKEFRKNVRQAIRSTVFNAPSLLLAKRALADLDDRKDMAYKILQETKKAREDGVVTRREDWRISRMQRKQVRRIRRDTRRLKRGSSSIARIWDTLDLDEIGDILGKIVFMMMAVLASGNSNSWIGNAISLYCHWLSLGSTMMETNEKIGMPLSKLILRSTIEPVLVTQEEKKEPSQLRIMLGTIIIYFLSAVFIMLPSKLGIKLNAAFIASSLAIKGISNLLNTQQDDALEDAPPPGRLSRLFHRGDNDMPELDGRLREFWGGMWTVILAMVALYFGKLVDEGSLTAPNWFDLFLKLEKVIDRIVVVADKL